ncbi:hypothetical protein ACROYT_G036983 [Oculina patagonica]
MLYGVMHSLSGLIANRHDIVIMQASLSTSSVTSSLDDVASIADENFVDDETWSDLQEDSTKKKRKFRRVRLRSIKAQGLPRQKGKTCCFLALCQARTCFSPFGKDASVALGSLCEEHRNCSCWRIPTPSSNLEEDHVLAKRLSKQISQCTKALRTAVDEYNRLECSPH